MRICSYDKLVELSNQIKGNKFRFNLPFHWELVEIKGLDGNNAKIVMEGRNLNLSNIRYSVTKLRNVFVADTGNNRIQRFDFEGNFIGKWGSAGAGEGQFNSPEDVAIDKYGFVYVVDGLNDRVQKFDCEGNFILEWGSTGAGNGQFNYPTSITVDINGDIYVVDSGNSRVQKFDCEGTYITKWGSEGTGDGQFTGPNGNRTRGICSDDSGLIYVCDSGGDRIEVFTGAGVFQRKWGTTGAGNGQFNNPTDIEFSKDGYVYVADQNNNRVQQFDLVGTYVRKWSTWGPGGTPLNKPSAIGIDHGNHIYVSEIGNDDVLVFEEDGTYITKWGSVGAGDGQFSNPAGIEVAAWQIQTTLNDDLIKTLPKIYPKNSSIIVTAYGNVDTGTSKWLLRGYKVDNPTGTLGREVYVIRLDKDNDNYKLPFDFTCEQILTWNYAESLLRIEPDRRHSYTNIFSNFFANVAWQDNLLILKMFLPKGTLIRLTTDGATIDLLGYKGQPIIKKVVIPPKVVFKPKPKRLELVIHADVDYVKEEGDKIVIKKGMIKKRRKI